MPGKVDGMRGPCRRRKRGEGRVEKGAFALLEYGSMLFGFVLVHIVCALRYASPYSHERSTHCRAKLDSAAHAFPSISSHKKNATLRIHITTLRVCAIRCWLVFRYAVHAFQRTNNYNLFNDHMAIHFAHIANDFPFCSPPTRPHRVIARRCMVENILRMHRSASVAR